MRINGVIIGRFQGDRLHEGYLAMLKEASKCKKVIIVLGKAIRNATDVDPIPAEVRKEMLHHLISNSNYPEICSNLTFVEIADVRTNEEWVKKLDIILESQGLNNKNFKFITGRDGFQDIYKNNLGKYSNFHIVDHTDPNASSTKAREEIKILEYVPKGKASVDFARGMIHASQIQYPRIDPVVDILPIVYDKSLKMPYQIILGQKPSNDKFQFPGGFVDLIDPTIESAAIRELKEETNYEVKSSDKLLPLGTTFINNWRYRKGHDRLLSNVFALLIKGEEGVKFTAGDDLKHIHVIGTPDLSKANLEHYLAPLLTDEHVVLFERLVEYGHEIEEYFRDVKCNKSI